MDFVLNYPFFAIMLYLASGVINAVLPAKISKMYCLVLNAVVAGLMACLLVYTLQHGDSYVYLMGHFPAPWGNEIRFGSLEAIMALTFAVVMEFSLLGGMEHIFEDTEPEKVNFYFTVSCLLMSSLMALVFTNDLFTAYVFVEINTIASCALVMLKFNAGKTIVATTKYLCMSLLGSSMFLIGIIILYGLTGHLLMQNIYEQVQLLYASHAYAFPLTVVIGLFSVGMATKSALLPFHTWLADAHGSATASSSAVLSGLVLKGYIFILIKIFYRVIGLEVIMSTHVTDILLVLGALAMILGSIRALQEKDLKRMLAYSSVAQIGYVYLGIGMGCEAGIMAACVQMVAHALTKPMLFCSAGGFMSVSGGSKKMKDITGAAYRDPLGAIAFVVGSLSMIGIPFFAGFVTKVYLSSAAISMLYFGAWKCVVAIVAIIISTLLNAMYYIPVIGNLFTKNTERQEKAHYTWEYVVAMVVFVTLNVFMGANSEIIVRAIANGLKVFG